MTHDTNTIEATILNAVTTAGLIPDSAGWRLRPASGGLNSRVFFLHQEGQPPTHTLRLSHPGKSWMIRHEASMLADLGNRCSCVPAGVTLISDQQLSGRLILAHAFAPGVTIPLETVASEQLAALGRCLACVHNQQGDVYTVWPRLQPTHGSRIAAYRDRLAAMSRYQSFKGGLTDDIHSRIHRLFETLTTATLPDNDGWTETTYSLLHGDTSAGNILWHEDSVTLIDWEYSRYGDPVEELAYTIAEQPLADDQVAALWESYTTSGGDPNAVRRARHYAPVVALDSTLWWADYHIDRDHDPGPSTEVGIHLGRAESLAQVI